MYDVVDISFGNSELAHMLAIYFVTVWIFMMAQEVAKGKENVKSHTCYTRIWGHS